MCHIYLDTHGFPYPREPIEPQLQGWVSEAAKVLDVHVPGWAERIDDENIRMGSCTECIFGQVFRENPLDKAGYVYAWNYLPWAAPIMRDDRGIVFAAVEALPFWIEEIHQRLLVGIA